MVIRLTTALVMVALAATGAQAQDGFYAGKTIELRVGFSAGGGYDTYARLLARHMGERIPGHPTIVVQNMPGAGSLKLTNWLAEAAPRDGTVFAIVSRSAPYDPLFGNAQATFDPLALTYIGSANNEVGLCATIDQAGIESTEAFLTQPVIVGGTGDTADTVQLPKILNAVLGAQLRIIKGFDGGAEILLSIERGELDGRCGWSWASMKATHADEIASGKYRLHLQMSSKAHPELPDVPMALDLASSDEDRALLGLAFGRFALGRPFVAPPGLPDDRIAALRAAFDATMADPEFLAEAAQANIEIAPLSGAEVSELVATAYEVDPVLVQRMSEILK